MVGAKRVSKGDWIMQIVINILMAVMLVLFLYPIWETVVRSLSTPETADHPGLKLWPREFTVDAYKNVLKNPDFLIGFRNSVMRTVLGSLIAVAFTFCGGYALSRRDLPGKGIITFYIVLTMFISAGLIHTQFGHVQHHLGVDTAGCGLRVEPHHMPQLHRLASV